MTTTKIIEVIGESNQSWDHAVQTAISEACKTIDGVSGVNVNRMTATVRDGKIVEYKANLEIAFPVMHK